ncbi:MAG TPA: S53 family peptidase, partial [Thermoanaerobaculia bacterium]|nr:S53 family peptidase [Thermoanaerobaculia bacterium]
MTRYAIPVFLASILALPAFAAPRAVDDRDRVPLRGNVRAEARVQSEIGSAPLELPMERVIVALSLRPGARAELDRLLAAQQDPASPDFRRWLTPEEFGARFGPRESDVARLALWLEEQGLSVEEIAKSRMSIDVTGTVADVERAFDTRIAEYEVNGRLHHANATDPTIPRAFAPLVAGVVSLHDFPRARFGRVLQRVTPEEIAPEYTSSSGRHYLAPADFSKIYDVAPVYGSGITGAGRTIAVVGRTDIDVGDVQYFRSLFGLPANDPAIVHNGTDPGNVGGGEEEEADLDVEWAGAVAKDAAVKLVVSRSTISTDGVDLSAKYIVNNNLADVMTTSFGACEQDLGSAENAFYSNLWSQAAAQGITSFVSSGDSGAAGCQVGSDATGSGHGVNGLCSTPYDVCVGGTQFADGAGGYWTSSNGSGLASVLSYIPEAAWNESGASGGTGLWATGGGASVTYAKPSWQVAPGVPNDGRRDVPDVSLSAAGHDAYLVVNGHTSNSSGLVAVGGTSASSPALASLMALVCQKTGGRLGNANVRLYQLGQAQYTGKGAAVFHDVTSGSNTVPGVTGFSCGSGFDQATGLGSVDAALLVASWSAAAAPKHGDVNGDGKLD